MKGLQSFYAQITPGKEKRVIRPNKIHVPEFIIKNNGFISSATLGIYWPRGTYLSSRMMEKNGYLTTLYCQLHCTLIENMKCIFRKWQCGFSDRGRGSFFAATGKINPIPFVNKQLYNLTTAFWWQIRQLITIVWRQFVLFFNIVCFPFENQ